MAREVKWVFVVQTNAYAGNLERELCAYVTGKTGEFSQGESYKKYVALFRKEHGLTKSVDEDDFPFANLVVQEPVEHDGYYHTDFCEMSQEDSSSVRIFLSRRPTRKDLEELKKRALAFPEARRSVEDNPKEIGCKKLAVTGFYLLKITTVTERVSA